MNAEHIDAEQAPRGGVVLGYDGSEPARAAMRWAIAEARLRDTVLVPVTVVPPAEPDEGTPTADDGALSAADHLLDEVAQEVRDGAADVPVTTVRVSDAPARGLVRMADRAELIVVGSRGRGGIESMLLGSVSLRVAEHAPCPTVVVPPGATTEGHGRVIVGIDGSKPSEAALEFALAEAALRHAEVLAVHSVAHPLVGSGFTGADSGQPPAREESGRRLLHHAVEAGRDKHPDLAITGVLASEPAAAALLERATDADLLVVGAHGHGAFTGMLLGSVSHAVLHASKVAVAVVRA